MFLRLVGAATGETAMAVLVEQQEIEPCRVALTVQVPPEDLRKAMDRVFHRLARRTTVPGFRPGKAPRNLVERYISQSQVQELAIDQALNDAFREALEQGGVRPYGNAEPRVELDEEEPDPEKGFQFTATVATVPSVKLGDFAELKAHRVVTRVTEEDVERELGRLAEKQATFQPSTEPVEEGDRIRATVEVRVDGEIDPDVSLPEPTLIQVGMNLEGFDAGVLGMRPGETKSFEFSYPEDFDDEAKRGKTAATTVTVLDALRRQVPPVDDALAQKLGFESLEALKERIRSNLQLEMDRMADQSVNDALLDQLVAISEVHFPSEMLEEEVSNRISDLMARLEAQGRTLDQYLEATKQSASDLQQSIREDAAQGVRLSLVMLEVARRENLAVDETELQQAIRARAEAENLKPAQLRRLLNETGEINRLRNQLFLRKVIARLREKATITQSEA